MTESGCGNQLDDESRCYFLAELRDSRAHAFKDAEGFEEILFTVERLGAFLLGRQEALGRYKCKLKKLAKKSPLFELSRFRCGPNFPRLYQLVQFGRNDAMHQGASARHLAINAAMLALVLEDALMSEGREVQDFMVRGPICAEMWQPLALIRQQMLLNSFSYLPVKKDNSEHKWYLVADYKIARYLRSCEEDERKRRLASPLESVVKKDHETLIKARCCGPSDELEGILKELETEPMLVVNDDDKDRLLGILTGFDVI